MNHRKRSALRAATSNASAPRARGWVDVADDGSGVVVVDGEWLFRAPAISTMSAYDGLVRGERVRA